MTKRVNESIEVNAPKEDVFAYWSNFENFPEFMQNIEEIRMTGEDTSHWKVKGPLGVSVEFNAKTTEMDPDRGINWDTVDGQVMTWGQVHFEPASEGRTRIEVMMDYSDPPGGQAGEAVASILSDLAKSMREDLQNFEKIVERGELGGPGAQSSSR